MAKRPKTFLADASKVPFVDPIAANKIVLALADDALSLPQFSRLFDPFMDHLAACPDPDRALRNFERFAGAVFSRSTLYGYLVSRPALLDLIVRLFASSQFLSDALIRNPEYLDLISDPLIVNQEKDKNAFLKELQQTLALFPKRESKLHVLQRFKRRELLRIGVRDILGHTLLEKTVGELSALADAIVQATLDFVLHECLHKYGVPDDESSGASRLASFSVIGMGKLGGDELNYSSDIDLMFVYSGEGYVKNSKSKSSPMSTHEFFNRVGEQLINILVSPSREGTIYRVDLRLRPEGETGPLARSLESYENYYSAWGAAWEQLALIKARVIAGDEKLGNEFIAMTRPFVYQRHLATPAIDEIRQLKRRIELKLASKGSTFTEVKLGFGGIREIEFSIQLLQLMYGAHRAAIRDANSLRAIALLGKEGFLSPKEVACLGDAYRFLRRVEHFLQIVDAFQIHQLPSDARDLERLAKRMGYASLETFRKDHHAHTQFVHAFHEKIFSRSMPAPAGEGADYGFLFQDDQKTKALDTLKRLGFQKPAVAWDTLQILAYGPTYMHLSTATVREFVHLAPTLLKFLGSSPDPDMALNEFERIVHAQGARTVFYKLLKSREKMMELLVRIAGISPGLAETLVREPSFLEYLARDSGLAGSKTFQQLLIDARAWLNDTPGGLKEFKDYEILRIGVRDVLGLADLPTTLAELSCLADVIFSCCFNDIRERKYSGIAILALGKWGSMEMGYHSDLDAIFVHEDDPGKGQAYQKISQRIIAALGPLYKMDMRLRPGGKNDVLAMPLSGYKGYYESRLQTWERQALTRLRFVAGDKDLANRLIELAQDRLFARGLSTAEVQYVRRMRERMTHEKLKTTGKGRNVKLDIGGIVDIEFAVQLLQLQWGWKFADLRSGCSLDIIQRAQHLELLDEGSAKILSSGYLFLRSLENRLRIISGQSSDTIPKEECKQAQLARGFGFRDVESFWKKYRDTTVEIRKVFSAVCDQAEQ